MLKQTYSNILKQMNSYFATILHANETSSLKFKIFYNKTFSFPTHDNMLFDMHEEIEPDLLQDRSDKEI